MRLADFILANTETILNEWETFARSIWPGPMASTLVLRDHAGEMLTAVAWDMKESQTDSEQSSKSKGLGGRTCSEQTEASQRVDSASNLHALSRLSSGFELRELVAEYRALRASVIHLWISSIPEAGPKEGQDIIRFNEAIDQSLAESIASFADKVDASREYFLGILGHDLRTPLAAATLFAYLLAESTTLDPDTRHMATVLRSSLDAMNHLVRDILDFTGARLGAKMEVRPRPMDLLPLCHEVLAEMRSIHPAHTFDFAAPDGDTTGRWDSGRLRQLISNLLGNAVQHGSATRPVTLTAMVSADSALLTVHNFGPPIPEEIIGVIFDPMKRHQSSGPTVHHAPSGSVGLGLYIAREVANAHGGSITVVSAGDETTFTVQLPRHCPDLP
ncbi:MAG: HAMP domain-containing sensor histidine kinase [Verrucomicrobiota bacterium]